MSLSGHAVDYSSLAAAGGMEAFAPRGQYEYEDLAAGHGQVVVDGEPQRLLLATAMQLMKCEAQDQEQEQEAPAPDTDHASDGEDPQEQEPEPGPDGELTEAELLARPKKRVKKLPLTPHDAVTLFAHKGVYVDSETGELRTSSNHKRCDKWDMYGYTRHFTFKVYKKYEAERLNTEEEQRRLLDAKERYFRLNPVVEESRLFRKKRKEKEAKEGPKVSKDEMRVQERHWMEMWQAAKSELKTLRDDMKNEADEGVRSEMMADIEGLKKRKGDWAQLLGLQTTPESLSASF